MFILKIPRVIRLSKRDNEPPITSRHFLDRLSRCDFRYADVQTLSLSADDSLTCFAYRDVSVNRFDRVQRSRMNDKDIESFSMKSALE